MDDKSAGQSSPSFIRDLDKKVRRRAVLRMVIQLIAFCTILLATYFLVPVGGFNEANPVGAWIRLIVVVLVFLAVMFLELRMIMKARLPQIRAGEAVVELILVLLCLFALLYLSISVSDPASFSEPLSRMDALYFTTSTFATVGFGDITPRTGLTRALLSVQMLVDLGALLLIGKVAFFAASKRLSR
ncbi:two pore domain potassium channel family protein [Arthrobacter pityocampae]|uniref:Two pore domain potassium channel family protein n=1 Tax=Arthrobacter pityocampae TaxID=547334 RepID=A0A2S5J1B4_9MICC|nr:potassium channel family protein [Arthrobacter pityocampae]PPB50594.1 two pore domain potassium channel family protein [Arthrobacter pityocampae]